MRHPPIARFESGETLNESDTRLIKRLKLGDKEAANELIGRYFQRVVRLAEKHLANHRVHGTGGEDIAASVFESLWKKADRGHFSDQDLATSEELWKLLCQIVAFKSRDHLRRESAQKRGGSVLKGESFLSNSLNSRPDGIANVASDQLCVADLLILKEEHDRLLKLLESEVLERIAIMRLEGFQVAEIAESFEKSERWVGRKLNLIRNIWTFDLDQAARLD